MAGATFTLSGKPEGFPSGNVVLFGTITMDSSYPTGGESLASLFATYLSSVTDVMPLPAGGYVPEFDSANNKLLAYYADYDAGADGALIQVANAVDLSAVIFPVIVRGKPT